MTTIRAHLVLTILFVVCFTRSNAQRAIQFTSCGGGTVKEVRASPCTEEPCIFLKGQESKVEVAFQANQISSKLTLKVSATIFGIDHAFPGMEEGTNACEGKGISCPIQYNSHQILRTVLQVPSTSPSLRTVARFNVTGESGIVFCFEAPVSVK